MAYGMKNGVIYRGEVPFVPVADPPAGEWRLGMETMVIDADEVPAEKKDAVAAVCRRLMAISAAYDFDDSCDTGLSFWMEPLLRTPEDIREYCACGEELGILLGKEYPCGSSLLYDSSDHPRILRIFEENNKFVGYEIAAT